jgi:hypothetical protein
MAGTPKSLGLSFSRTADLKAALRAHCEERLQAFLVERNADRRAYSRLLAAAGECCKPEPESQSALRKGLGSMTKVLDGDLGRGLDLFAETLRQWAGTLAELASEQLPQALEGLELALFESTKALNAVEAQTTANIDAATQQKLVSLSELRKTLETVRSDLGVRRETLESEQMKRGLPYLKALAASKTPAATLKSLDDLAAEHPNKGALRALLTMTRWRQEAVAQASDFEALADLVARQGMPRARLARRFAEGFKIRVGSGWKTVSLNARQIACLSILCGNLPGVIEGLDLSKPSLNPPLKGRLVLDHETQTMRVHLREFKGTRKNR